MHDAFARTAVAAALAFALAGCAGAHKSDDAAASAPSVTLAVARRGDLAVRVQAQGRIGPPAGSSAKVAFAQAGIVQNITVRVGDTVGAGQTLAELDRAALASSLAQAEADARVASAGYAGGAIANAGVASAKARLAVALARLQTLQRGGPSALSSRIAAESAARQAALKVDADRAALARSKTLLGAGVVAQKDVEAAQSTLDADLADARAADAKAAAAATDFDAALKSAQADVATARGDLETARAQSGVLGGQASAAQARLAAARIAYANGILTAPADGVVLAILKHPGEAVDPSQPVVEIGPALGKTITLGVPGDVARRIVAGDAATVQAAQARGGATAARVVAVVPAVDPATQLATVVIDGTPPGAVPGDAVTASIVVGHASGVIVPSGAIVQDPQSGKTVVFVKNAHPKAGDPDFTLREVEVRASDESSASIASGLRPGEAVAAQGGYALLAPAGGG